MYIEKLVYFLNSANSVAFQLSVFLSSNATGSPIRLKDSSRYENTFSLIPQQHAMWYATKVTQRPCLFSHAVLSETFHPKKRALSSAAMESTGLQFNINKHINPHLAPTSTTYSTQL